MKIFLPWILAGALAAGIVPTTAAQGGRGWPQWGRDARHHGMAPVTGQRLDQILAVFLYDPFVEQERAEQFGVLAAHFQVPLVDRNDVFMEWKTGTYISCDPPGWMTHAPCGVNTWSTQIWNERRLHWENGQLVEKWNFASDWKPPQVPAVNFLGPSEPVFHAIVVRGHVYVPGAGGTLFKLDRLSGRVVARINPFRGLNRHIYTAGAPVADANGNLYYQAFRLAPRDPWTSDVRGAWLIKVRPDGSTARASFSDLAVGAPAPDALCRGQFPDSALPWPPSPDAVPPLVPCGSQRPGINATPAIGPDGTVYVPSRAHRSDRHSYLLAVNPDLTPRWAASLRGLLSDGCGTSTLPPTGSPGGCRAGAHPGVDPATNELPAGRVVDAGTNAPVVAPDGTLYFGVYTEYNGFRGKLFKFSRNGRFLGAYDYGLDVTPSIYTHDGTYSVILKENHYALGYCADPTLCPTSEPGHFYITQIAPDLTPEWKFLSTNTESCRVSPDGPPLCVSDHPHGFEWCVNATAVDRNGVVYANSEDGNLYAISQGGVEKQRIFLQLALGAAYTPLSIGPDGKIYTQNAGLLFVVGNVQ